MVLHKPAALVGFAQMATLLPMPLLLLFGGAAADRRELKRQLLVLQSAMILPHVGLAAVIASDNLTYAAILLYGIAITTLGGFIVPARDAFLPAVVRRARVDLTQAIAIATGTQFGGQLIGLALAGLASRIGALPLLGAAFLFTALAAFAMSRLGPQPSLHAGGDKSVRALLKDIGEGLERSLASEAIRPVIILLFGGGVLFMGMFLVGMPLLIRDVYKGGSEEFALLNMSFMAGVLSATLLLARLRPIRRRGRAMMLATGGGVFAMTVMHFAPPEPVLFLVMFIWGSTGGVSMSMSRAIVQDAAADSHRARVISVYQLAQLGGGPIGALATGFLIEQVGVLNAMLFPLVGIVFLWGGVYFFTPLWRVARPATE